MSNNYHIMIVDDSTTNNLLSQIIFQEKGYKTTILENGKKAIETIKKNKPDIVLLDLMMPIMDGLTVLKNIRQDEETRDTPVIIVSAADTKSNIEEVEKYHPIDFIAKPIGQNHLLEKVEEHLKVIKRSVK